MKLIKVAVACVNQTPFAWDDNFAHLRMAIEHARAEGVDAAVPARARDHRLRLRGRVLHGRPAGHRVRAARGARAADARAWSSRSALPVYHEKALYNAAALLADGEIVGFVGEAVPRRRRHPLRAALVQGVAGRRGRRARAHRRRTARSAATRSATSCSTSATSASASRSARTRGSRTARAPTSRCAASTSCCNPSASHFAFGKFAVRQRFVVEGSRAFGVAYLYANLLGNEAGRVDLRRRRR